MNYNQIIESSATMLAQKIKMKEVTSYVVVSTFLEQIENQNKIYNAVVYVNKDVALERAKQADVAIENGENW